MTTAVYQINCGGPAADPFTADQFVSGGNTYRSSATITTAGVANAAPQAVYQAERWGDHSYTLGSLTPNG
ncbi:MAG TPA: malectin domain-containing carbohydrate-binding protein, partial [Polyangiaceae bacterium]